MSRPPGPPPYTAEQIASLSTPKERFVAQAELNSYITGHKMADLREQGLLDTSPNYSQTFGATSHGKTNDGSHDELDIYGDQDVFVVNAEAPTRGKSGLAGTRGHKARREYSGFQPYTRARPASRHYATSAVESTQDGGSPYALGSYVDNERAQGRGTPIKFTVLCPAFTSTGTCARVRCARIHDPNKLALCKRFLYKQKCTKGDRCRLSHQPTSNNSPHCLYYLDGRCTNASCLFAHTDVESAALVCNSFGRIGYCEKGTECTELHVYECPEFANEGTCKAGDDCTLRHIHHASRMKARRSSAVASPQSEHDNEDDGETIGARNLQENTHGISQQDDYVPFDLDD